MQITLRAARMNVPLTQKEAADQIGVTVDTVGNWAFLMLGRLSVLKKYIIFATIILFFCPEKRFKR